MKHQASPDLADLVESLDADAIAHRLEDLYRQEAALRVLLRSARARQHARRRRESCPGHHQGVPARPSPP